MDQRFATLMRRMDTRAGASEQALRHLQEVAGVQLPDDYLQFLRWSNGAEGEVGDNYISIWPAEQIASDPYPYQEFVPGLLFIASDGGAGLFGYDTGAEPMPIMATHTDDLDRHTLVEIAPSFLSFLEFLAVEDWVEYWGEQRCQS